MINRIRVLRAERTWSQADLAERLDVTRQTINAVENGKHDPSLPFAYAMARVFAVNVLDIFPDPDQPPRT